MHALYHESCMSTCKLHFPTVAFRVRNDPKSSTDDQTSADQGLKMNNANQLTHNNIKRAAEHRGASVSTLREAAAANQLHRRSESQISSLAKWHRWIYGEVEALQSCDSCA